MISLDNTIISDDIRDVFFCCDLEKCKGACCIEGDAGAPLEEMEISLLEDYIDEIKPFMAEGGIREVGITGVFDYDAAGNFVTPLVQGEECVFVYMEGGIARCAIEKAFQDKKIPFPKPLSCHLYPIRIGQLKEGESVNYHKWPICNKALDNGMKLKLPLYQFLEQPLIRKYGRNWYNRLLKLLH
jgi:Fe-S-cluster containining protein